MSRLGLQQPGHQAAGGDDGGAGGRGVPGAARGPRPGVRAGERHHLRPGRRRHQGHGPRAGGDVPRTRGGQRRLQHRRRPRHQEEEESAHERGQRGGQHAEGAHCPRVPQAAGAGLLRAGVHAECRGRAGAGDGVPHPARAHRHGKLRQGHLQVISRTHTGVSAIWRYTQFQNLVEATQKCA